ncbi:MAG TPA: biopolymer transporter ExbD, partial [Piscinibacter sp.]|nr:biopolymer transporter ExbD [Piscinibacter sp.]
LVDVMLVLVVIFIITAPLMASSIRLDLPRAENTQPGDAPAFVSVVVDKAGQSYLDDQPLTPDELGARLAQLASRRADTEVQLRADEGVPYGRVVEVIGLAQKAGLSRIGFLADPLKATPAKR